MKKINVLKWKEKDQNGKEYEVDLLRALTVLLNIRSPDKMPRGFDKFRMFSRIDKAFKNAEETNILELDDIDYKFLKETVETEIPSTWGMNLDIVKAIEEFLNPKE